MIGSSFDVPWNILEDTVTITKQGQHNNLHSFGELWISKDLSEEE